MSRPVAWFSRADYAVSRVVLVLCGVVVTLATVGVPLLRAVTGQPMVGRISVDEAAAGAMAKGATLVPPALVQVEVPDVPVGISVLLILPGIVLTMAAISVIVALWRVTASAEKGDPFTIRNVRGLQASGVTLVFGGLLHWLISGIASGAMTDLVLGDGSIFVAEITSTQFLIFAFGVMMALVAAILERGVKLEEDVEGLV
ncbi:DUF2975 domain-containing protein [Tessaracoccus palaemonis]|uniref:DUF2975 domain-containing protein n=1 Tax=Tessaracoccus palaemonis TaxID=2829499 RepID=A0ABX8SGJ5_9ACTN|nr:DUF2975 domain-containing protein [Tessaracoccus palaemonis]QXT62532.1 DUF2975 domain-containing protein [Tessaracoccus palaemonis]